MLTFLLVLVYSNTLRDSASHAPPEDEEAAGQRPERLQVVKLNM